MGKAFNAVGKLSTLITIGIGIAGVKAAVDFESALTRVSTQAGVSKSELKGLGDALLKLSPKVGFNPDDLATSLYHVESAFRTTGISAKNAIGIVEQASKLSKIGNADLETTTQAIIGVLASKIGGVKDAQDAAAQLNQLVGTGDTTLQKVAQSIATGILPTAATLGLTFKDVAAGLATLTDNVTPADTAARILKTSLLTLIKPSQQQVTAFQEIGLGALQLGQDFRQPNGLLVGVTDLKNHLDAVFPAGQKTALTVKQLDGAQKSYYQNLVSSGTNVKDATKQSQAFRDSITGVSTATLRANAVARALGGSKTAGTFLTFIQEIDRLQSKYKDFGTSAQAATKFQQAWVQQQGTAKQKLAELDASWHVFLVNVGNAILPDLKKIVDVLAQHPGIIKAAAGAVAVLAAAWTVSKFANAFSVLGRLAAAILGIGTASATAATEVAAANLGGAATAGGAAAAGVAGKGAAAAGAGAAVAEGAAATCLGAAFSAAAAPLLAGAVITAVGITLGQNFIDKHTKQLPHNVATNFNLDADSLEKTVPQFSSQIAQVQKRLGLMAGDDFTLALASGLDPEKAFAPIAKNFKIPNLFNEAGQIAANAYVEPLKAIQKDQKVITDFGATLNIANNLLDTNSTTLLGNSNAAVTNRDAIALLAKKAKEGADAQLRLTGKQSDYTAALKIGVGAIESTAEALGFNKQQVDTLLTALGLLPASKAVPVTTPGVDTALVNLQNIKDALDRIPLQKQVDISVLLTGTAPDALIAQAAGGTGHGFGGGRVATGGLLRGPGTGTSDSLVARVSNGEYVVKASSVSKYGVGFLNSVNAGRYARGGYVGMPGKSGGVEVHVHLSTLDTKTAEQALRNGLAKTIAIEVKRATGYGMTLN